ncbi:hypothetical protein [Streptomyces sp. NPDC096323]|uniref:hypothetical protein n=1 Tax=Streptomyces sp. NPDC096323 TaxID=3155822 RepID=UPI00332E1C63
MTDSSPVLGSALLLATAVLLAGSTLGLLLLRGRRLRGIPATTAFFAAVVAGAVFAGAALPDRGEPQQTAAPQRPGVPSVHKLHLGGQHMTVMVVPNRPGPNLVAVGGAETVAAGADRDRLTAGTVRAGSAQKWVPVNLPAGESRLWVSAAGAKTSIEVNTGARADTPAALRGADGPECAAAATGALVAGSVRTLTSCPSDSLAATDRSALRSVVAFLAGRGTRTAALVSDGSPRGKAAAAVVRAAAADARITLAAPTKGPGTAKAARPLIVVAGWQEAESTIRAVAAGRLRAQGSYLAPWLLTRPLLVPGAGQLIPLRYAPRTELPMAYVSALSALLPGEYPSGAGYEGWRRTMGGAATDDASSVRLYATAVMYIPGSPLSGPGAGEHRHKGTTTADWLPNGMIASVAGPFKEKGA